MHKLHLVVVFIFASIVSVFAQKMMFEQPLSPRIANYEIHVKLDPEEKMLYGKEILNWKNDSGDSIEELQFHLYLNAFKNERSTFMRESGGRHRIDRMDRKNGWGWTDITSFKMEDGTDLTDAIEFIHPDNDDSLDQTVIRIPLAQRILPGRTSVMEIEWEAKLPKSFARTGYKDDFFMIGQWFPKIGVYEEAGERYATNGQWNTHQFHSNSEFFADFGVYDVYITLPREFVVGATGVLVDEQQNDDGTKTMNFYCEDVHDFAWAADPHFEIVEAQWKHVKITYLVQPARRANAWRQIQAAKNALEYCQDRFGEYPYPTLTIVDPKYGATGAAGMEYPTLITAGMYWLVPEGIRLPEEIVVHEFAHNYFYGIIASNEFEEAWLDEGMTTYATIKVLEKYYGSGGGSLINLFGLNIAGWQFEWRGYSAYADRDIVVKNAWEYDRGGYGAASYNKPAMMLLTLENYFGVEKWKMIMRSYYDRFRYKHPTSRDFIQTVNKVGGEDMNWFFGQALYSTAVLDYAVDKISSKRKSSRFPVENDTTKTDSGFVGSGDSLPELSTADSGDGHDSSEMQISTDRIFYENKVILERLGEFIFPVELKVEFNGGEVVREQWDGKDRYKIFLYERESRLKSAQIDPDRKVYLDVDFLNNWKTLKTSKAGIFKYSLRWFFWMQNLLQLVTVFS